MPLYDRGNIYELGENMRHEKRKKLGNHQPWLYFVDFMLCYPRQESGDEIGNLEQSKT